MVLLISYCKNSNVPTLTWLFATLASIAPGETSALITFSPVNKTAKDLVVGTPNDAYSLKSGTL